MASRRLRSGLSFGALSLVAGRGATAFLTFGAKIQIDDTLKLQQSLQKTHLFVVIRTEFVLIGVLADYNKPLALPKN